MPYTGVWGPSGGNAAREDRVRARQTGGLRAGGKSRSVLGVYQALMCVYAAVQSPVRPYQVRYVRVRYVVPCARMVHVCARSVGVPCGRRRCPSRGRLVTSNQRCSCVPVFSKEQLEASCP